jgi:hypothetical protein
MKKKKKVKKVKPERKKIVTMYFERETLRKLEALKENYKTLNKSDIVRYAVEWALHTEKFMKILRELDEE